MNCIDKKYKYIQIFQTREKKKKKGLRTNLQICYHQNIHKFVISKTYNGSSYINVELLRK